MTHLLAFDSGIGGYGIAAALRARMPEARITMLADNAFYPYGEIADAVLIARIERVLAAAVDRLRPDLVVIACNTASTVALGALRARFDVPFIGCVPPIKWAATLSHSRHIGVLATAATVRRPYLADLAQRFAPDCRLIAHGARGLADLAEAVFRGAPVERASISRELDGLFGQAGGERIDTVCIGCTHYGVLLAALRQASPPGITWLDPAEAVARRTETVRAGLALPQAHRSGTAALFTASPFEAERLAASLNRVGYDGFSLFDVEASGLGSAQDPLGPRAPNPDSTRV